MPRNHSPVKVASSCGGDPPFDRRAWIHGPRLGLSSAILRTVLYRGGSARRRQQRRDSVELLLLSDAVGARGRERAVAGLLSEQERGSRIDRESGILKQ